MLLSNIQQKVLFGGSFVWLIENLKIAHFLGQ
jgi:hypothetical protein